MIDDPVVRTTWPNLSDVERDVLRHALVRGTVSRAQMADVLHVSRPTLTRAARALTTLGMLSVAPSIGRARSSGRPSELLEATGGTYHFVGVKLTSDHLYVAVTDLRAQLCRSWDRELPSHDVTTVLAAIVEAVHESRKHFTTVVGVGVTLGGFVDMANDEQTVTASEHLGWDDVHLRSQLEESIGLPVVVANDVQALTVAEHWFGAGAGTTSMALVTIGIGTGCGIVVNNELIRGAHGRPGRVDHIAIDRDGPVCDLGHRGCASSHLRTESIRRALSLPHDVDALAVAIQRSSAGELAAGRVIDDAGFALGVVIGTVVNLADPEKVILSGAGLPLYEVTRERVRDGMVATGVERPEDLVIEAQPFGYGEWAWSAAAISIQELLRGPARSASGLA